MQQCSVLRTWVMELSYRAQGTLVVATRGCDLAPKLPLDSPERRMTASIRYAVMVPADAREVDYSAGCFMLSRPQTDVKLAMFEHYPLHFVSHIIHACQVIGFHYPDPDIRRLWHDLYLGFVKSLHMNPETEDQCFARLAEDRIADKTVVSL